jgi:DNA-binding CsgD family transcriptional regulator
MHTSSRAVLSPYREPRPELHPLELAVLHAAAAGERTTTTAERLRYSERYVLELRRRARERLEVSTIEAAVAAAFRLGLLR